MNSRTLHFLLGATVTVVAALISLDWQIVTPQHAAQVLVILGGIKTFASLALNLEPATVAPGLTGGEAYGQNAANKPEQSKWPNR